MLDARGTAVPAFIHWGADIGETTPAELVTLAEASRPAIGFSSPDAPLRSTVLPTLSAGWQGHTAISGDRAVAGLALVSASSDGSCATVVVRSDALEVSIFYELTIEGLLCITSTATNLQPAEFTLEQLNIVLPVADNATEILDFSGHWSAERQPQRHERGTGAWLRETRHGRPGHDAPYLLVAGTPSFGFRRGEVWAVHFGWSGNQRHWIENQVSTQPILGVGELLAIGEIVLAEGSSYTTPTAYAAFAPDGLDGISARFHRYLRRTTKPRSTPRPVILNTWEAVYFDHDETTLRQLAATGAALGVERFVLDDGWMNRRTDDHRGLGDWQVDAERWPVGLGPLAQYVNSLGMEFGLWVEPEMANLDSDVARQHAEWIVTDTSGSPGISARHQYVLDLTNPAAFAHVLEQLSALLTDYPIRYLKWDHNRDLYTVRSHAQTLAVYRLMDALSERHPQCEIESCASGGARIDFGMLQRTSRVWPSDTNDPHQRQQIYRWTTLLLPPEMFGAHLGAATAHTTGRTNSLSFRLATALFGWAGIEWDVTTATPTELGHISSWLATYKLLRPLLHSGTVVRADRADETVWVHGVVAADLREAVFAIVSLDISRDSIVAPVRLVGLDPSAHYTVTIADLGAEPTLFAAQQPPWLTDGIQSISGRLLCDVGIAAPQLAPDQALVLKVSAL